jgi:hypothetical protein
MALQGTPSNRTSTGQLVLGTVPRAGLLLGLHLAAGSATAIATIYDNASAASGTILAVLSATAGLSDDLDICRVPFSNGLWAVLTGTGASLTAYYE